MRNLRVTTLLFGAALIGACAGSDNPTALADLDPQSEFEFSVIEVETMHAVEITARAREGGSLMQLRNVQIEVQPPNGPARLVGLAGDEHGYAAHVRFYEPGEHHLHLLGQPERHHLMRELGEHEVEVEAQHQVHENHRFELSVSPAPIVAGVPARIRLHAWEIELDGTLGHEAEGLDLHATLHMPDGVEIPITLNEVEHGEYSVDLTLPAAGSYELSVEVEEGAGVAHSLASGDPEEDEHGEEHAGVEFEIYVPSLGGVVVDAPAEEEDGHGH